MAHANMDKAPYECGLEEYPPDWQEDFQRLSDLVLDLAARYGDRILIRIWDPRSLQGLIKAIRYGVHCYPTFVVRGGKKVVGLDMPQLEQTLQAAGAVVQSEHFVAPQP